MRGTYDNSERLAIAAHWGAACLSFAFTVPKVWSILSRISRISEL